MPKYVKGKKKTGGKKKGTRHLAVITREALEAAIRTNDKKHRTSLLTHFIEKSRVDSHVLIALMKKLLADRKEVDQTITNEDLKITVTIENDGDGGASGKPEHIGSNVPDQS